MHGVPGWDIFLMRGANAPRAPASLTPSLRSQASRVPWPGTSPHRPPGTRPRKCYVASGASPDGVP
jgi:hypothetical protein